ncbi:MAG: small subunit ribosomal protein S13 [Parcubacteria group bacterium Gr01-1014_31]|nr:MAG: small subunit ribosomal protein S13 [Parcubacteria group bacterium Gr01-1014_31]
MARISGITLPPQKRVEIGLMYLYGIGRSRSISILQQAKVNPNTRVKDLSEREVNALREIIEKRFQVEGELRREVMMNVKRLKEIGCYRGVRHLKRLPVRGQRTKTNSRTVRGNVRRTMGSGRKTTAQKT